MNANDPLKEKLEVTILFRDARINDAFAALLEAEGVMTSVPSGMPKNFGTSRIITEPDYFPAIPSELHGKCLVVGPAEALKNLPTLTLSQPLTEDKIERVLGRFLAK